MTSISPDGRHTAVVLSVNCGAMSEFATWLVVHPTPRESFKDPVLALDGHDREVQLSWIDNQTLRVGYVDKDAFPKKDRVGDVKISFAPTMLP